LEWAHLAVDRGTWNR